MGKLPLKTAKLADKQGLALVTQQRYQRGGRQKLKWGHVA